MEIYLEELQRRNDESFGDSEYKKNSNVYHQTNYSSGEEAESSLVHMENQESKPPHQFTEEIDWSSVVKTLLPSRGKSLRSIQNLQKFYDVSYFVTLPRKHKNYHDSYIAKRLERCLSEIRCKSKCGLRRRCNSFHEFNIAESFKNYVPLSKKPFQNIHWNGHEYCDPRLLPIPMSKKREYRNHFDRGYLDYNTLKRKIDHQHQELKEHTVDIWNKIKRPFTFWKEDLKRIEGRYGTGVLSYFLFLQWLVYLNLLMTIIVISFIVIPENIFHFKEQSISNTSVTNTTYFHSQIHVSNLECGHKFCNVEYATNTNYTQKNPVDLAYFCSGNYSKNIEKKNYVIEKLQEFLQGTGWMELTPMFIGWYTPTEMRNIDVKPSYDIPITYMLVTFSYFLLCLILMVFYTRRSIRENVMKAESQLQRFCNMVFTGWDFSIEDKKLAEIKHGNIHQNLRSHLAAARRYAEISQWSTRKKFRVTFLRIMVNIFVVIILALSGYCIYEAVYLAEQVQGDTGLIAFLTEYLSSIIITALNLFLPKLFNCLAKLEQYSLSFTIKITLLRCVFSQLASVCVLIATLHNLVMCDDKTECGNGIGDCKAPVCWETYVGQQIYKLAILDFATVIIVTFLVGYPKKIIAEQCQCKLISCIKREEFNIPDNVLSLVSSQTLCWLGAFYSPFLPLLSLIKYIAIFYVKKYSLFVICVPAKEPYKTSKSNTFFMIVLMLSYLIGLFSFVYSVSTIMPSRGCGPFRIYDTAWDTITVFISRFPPQVITVLYFIGSAGFGIPAFIILSLLLYYYLTISATYGQMADILKDHLLVEGRDKHFLLKKLMIILRQPEL